jgi:predicted ester cyclase
MGYATVQFAEGTTRTAVVAELIDSINRNDLAALDAHDGLDTLRAQLPALHEAFADWETTYLRQIADHATVFSHYCIAFTHVGVFAGVEATGRRVTLEVFALDHLEDGIVVQRNSTENWAGVARQLGVSSCAQLPAPVTPDAAQAVHEGRDLPLTPDPMLAQIARAHFGTRRASMSLSAAVAALGDEIRALSTAFPDLQPQLVTRVVDGDMVATHTVLRGTHLGPLYGLAPTGKAIVWDKYCLARLSDGTIVEYAGGVNWTGALRSLGLFPD